MNNLTAFQVYDSCKYYFNENNHLNLNNKGMEMEKVMTLVVKVKMMFTLLVILETN